MSMHDELHDPTGELATAIARDLDPLSEGAVVYLPRGAARVAANHVRRFVIEQRDNGATDTQIVARLLDRLEYEAESVTLGGD